MRDPNERMLMSSLGVDSPMFDFVEQICGRPNQAEPDKKRRQLQEIEKKAKRLQERDAFEEAEGAQFEEEEPEDELTLAATPVDASECEIIKSSLQLLEDI